MAENCCVGAGNARAASTLNHLTFAPASTQLTLHADFILCQITCPINKDDASSLVCSWIFYFFQLLWLKLLVPGWNRSDRSDYPYSGIFFTIEWFLWSLMFVFIILGGSLSRHISHLFVCAAILFLT